LTATARRTTSTAKAAKDAEEYNDLNAFHKRRGSTTHDPPIAADPETGGAGRMAEPLAKGVLGVLAVNAVAGRERSR
jgi:hypothetical protein